VSETTPQGVTVTVLEDGSMLVNDAPTSDAELFAVLEAALSDTRDKLVILKGDKNVLLGKAVNILDLAQQAGATGIALATKPPDKKG
jgi:biopolymer transport protein ExbD